MLTLQLALEDGAFLGSPGVIDEDACETDVTDKCKFANHFRYLIVLFCLLVLPRKQFLLAPHAT